MRDKAQHEFVFDPNPPYQIIKSKYLNENQLEDIVKLEHALEIYWNGKKAINTLKYIIENHSSFDFLLGLGKYFGTRKDYHKYSLDDVFLILNEFINTHFSNNIILKELVAIDYYLYHKVKPKPLLINEIDKKLKFELLEKNKLNHHKYRFVALPINFDFKTKATQNKNVLFIQYDGINKATIV